MHIQTTVHSQGAAYTTPPNYTRVRKQHGHTAVDTQTDTQTYVITSHLASPTTHVKFNYTKDTS